MLLGVCRRVGDLDVRYWGGSPGRYGSGRAGRTCTLLSSYTLCRASPVGRPPVSDAEMGQGALNMDSARVLRPGRTGHRRLVASAEETGAGVAGARRGVGTKE
jgi:hypothetical protein